MNSNLDPHQQLEEWLVDGAANDPPREMAFHFTKLNSAARIKTESQMLLYVGANWRARETIRSGFR
jgi:hypothetical protein